MIWQKCFMVQQTGSAKAVFGRISILRIEVRIIFSLKCYHPDAVDQKALSQPVTKVHACNSSYLGGGHQEDCGSRPTWAKS
jgi:hypothetical protein